MKHRPRKRRLENLAVPLEFPGFHVDVTGLSLCQGPSGENHVGLFLQAAGGPPESATHLFLSLTDATFLRDGLSQVLEAFRSRRSNVN
jgi:hypothetical protein